MATAVGLGLILVGSMTFPWQHLATLGNTWQHLLNGVLERKQQIETEERALTSTESKRSPFSQAVHLLLKEMKPVRLLPDASGALNLKS